MPASRRIVYPAVQARALCRASACPMHLLIVGRGRWFGGRELSSKLRRGTDVRGLWIGGLLDFSAENVAGAKHVAGEDDQLLIGREADVGLKAIVVVRHVDKVFGVKDSGLPKVRPINAGDV